MRMRDEVDCHIIKGERLVSQVIMVLIFSVRAKDRRENKVED